MADRTALGFVAASLALLVAVVLIHLAVILPNHPDAMTPGALRVFPLETPAIVAVLIAVRGAWTAPVRIAIMAFLTLMVTVRLADFGAHVAFHREFNLALDLHLLPAAWRMLGGAIGAAPAAGMIAAAGLGLALLAAALWWATGRIARLSPPPGAAAIALVALALLAADRLRPAGLNPPGTTFTLRLAAEHVRDARRAREDLRHFRVAASIDPAAEAGPDGRLERLRGRDVLIVFVESYGRTALVNPRYADTTGARLAAIDAGLAEAGLAARSGFLTSPVSGGQSWLAHATLLSGLWIDSQGRYQALMASPRRTLLRLAREAGWSSAAVMPGITLDWPDSVYFGYDRILAAADLDYRGPPFNWVTMPDQFTLAAFERTMLAPVHRLPVFAELALISSHAPWTPVPRMIPWDEVGDGTVFAQFLANGPPADEVWRNRDQIRMQYLAALDYSLEAAGAFAVRRADAAPLVVLLGDHQPASFVSEMPDDRAVPIHLIGPPDILAAIDEWDWTDGMRPAPEAPEWPMDTFRDRFLAAFSADTAPARPPEHAAFAQ